MKRDIDDIVKSALENFEVPYDAESWDALQVRMEQQDAEQFDEEIVSRMHKNSTRYKHTHWLQLKEWLDYSWEAVSKIYISKSAEAVLMILALFTFFNYLGDGSVPQHRIEQSVQTSDYVATNHIENSISPSGLSQDVNTTESNNQKESVEKESNSHSVSAGNRGLIDNDEEAQIKRTNIHPSTAVDPRSNGENESLTNEIPRNSIIKMGANTSDQNGETDIPFRSESSATPPIQKLPTFPLIPSMDVKNNSATSATTTPVADNIIDTSADSDLESRETRFSQLLDFGHLIEEEKMLRATTGSNEMSETSQGEEVTNPLDRLSIDEFDLSPQNLDLALVAIEAANPGKLNSKWALSAYSALDFNSITTPYDQQYQNIGYNQNRVGVGGGINLHRHVGAIELSTGVAYSSKRYSPKDFLEWFKKQPGDNFSVFAFEGVKLNMLTIPLHVTYTLNKSDKWRVYVFGGGAIHLALESEYQKEIEENVTAQPNIDDNISVGRQPQFELKSFPDGLLEDGSFRQNHYFTANVGLGIERQISPLTSVFLQPTVYYNLFNKGLSANNDKINTFSFQLGLKTRI